MPKTCIANDCNYFVWSKGFCKYHQNSRTDSKYQLKRESVLKPTKSKRIKPISDKQKERLAIYRVVRDKYLKENPICQFPGCNATELDLHHLGGRVGSLLTDVSNFCGLCRYHHEWVGSNHLEALEMGLVKDRLTVGVLS